LKETDVNSNFGLVLGGALLASTILSGGALAAGYKVTNLVSDQQGVAKVVDPNLVDAWGLSQSPGGPVWVADNGTNLTTVYNRNNGGIGGIVANIPLGAPTGTVYVPGNLAFDVTENGVTGPASFLFDSEAGIISGWSGGVDQSNAIVAVNNSGSAVYKGLAIDTASGQLFAANFCQNKIEVYDHTFTLKGSFTDTSLPSQYAPFNIADVNGALYVAFAKRDNTCKNEVDGKSLGYVDVFNLNGQLQKQLIAKGHLNAPWGLAIAPSQFGSIAGYLMVGNFGDGQINIYDPATGAYISTLSKKSGKPIVIQGLWSLDPGPNSNEVNFSAGPGGETHGLFGVITPN